MRTDSINIVANINIGSLFQLTCRDISDICDIPVLFKMHQIGLNGIPCQKARHPLLSNRLICGLHERLNKLHTSVLAYSKLSIFWKIIGIFSGTFFKYKRLQRCLAGVIAHVNAVALQLLPVLPLKPPPIALPVTPPLQNHRIKPVTPETPFAEIEIDSSLVQMREAELAFTQKTQDHLKVIAERIGKKADIPMTRYYAPVLKKQPSANPSLQALLQFSKIQNLNPNQIQRRDALISPNKLYLGSTLAGSNLKFSIPELLIFLKEMLKKHGTTIDPVFISGQSGLHVLMDDPSPEIELSIFSSNVDGIHFWYCVKAFIAFKLGAYFDPDSPLLPNLNLTSYYDLHSVLPNFVHLSIGNVVIKLRETQALRLDPNADKVLVPLTSEDLALLI